MICYGVCRDAHQPGHKGATAPLELAKVRESLAKHFRGDIFDGGPVREAPRDVCVYAIKIALVELGETRWIALRGFDEDALVRRDSGAATISPGTRTR